MDRGQNLWYEGNEEFIDILLEFFRIFFVGQFIVLEFDVNWGTSDVIPKLGSFLQFVRLN
jgi:hypothetical protein